MHRKGGKWMRRSDDSTGVVAVEIGASLARGRPAAGGERRAMTETRAEIDEITLSAARRGDHLAFAEVVRHYDPRLRHLAFHLLPGDGCVDDVLQEVYLRAFRGLARFRRHSTLSTWLYRITYNCCVTRLRKSEAGIAEESHTRRGATSLIPPQTRPSRWARPMRCSPCCAACPPSSLPRCCSSMPAT